MTWKVNNTRVGFFHKGAAGAVWVGGGDAPFLAPSGSLSICDGEGWGKKDTGYLYKAAPPLVPTRVTLRNILVSCLLLLAFALTACNNQSQQVDPRLKYFVIIDSRVLIEGNGAEVFGEVENTSKMQFPFDVTMQADLMDISGQTVGTATGTAEDVGMGQVRQFMLVGTVDGTRYARLKVTPTSLQEKRQELGWPTPTPISP